MTGPGKHPEWSALSALALVGQVGLILASAILVGVVGGIYLDRWVAGHGLILVAMILLGIAAGLYGAYKALARELKWNR